MKTKEELSKRTGPLNGTADNDALPGYPAYPANEDIYHKLRKEDNINPEDITKTKEIGVSLKAGDMNELDFTDDVSGGDLDIPDAELDVALEAIACDDEENNYYSIGGDNHNDLEESKGE